MAFQALSLLGFAASFGWFRWVSPQPWITWREDDLLIGLAAGGAVAVALIILLLRRARIGRWVALTLETPLLLLGIPSFSEEVAFGVTGFDIYILFFMVVCPFAAVVGLILARPIFRKKLRASPR
jgi:hypothetical protein